MYSLNKPAINDRNWYNRIAITKDPATAAHLLSARRRVYKAYDDYLAAAPDVHLAPVPAPVLSLDEQVSLKKAYYDGTVPVGKMKRRLTLGGLLRSRCPYCGIGEALTFDHYLPSSLYPQFSIFGKNLAPCCDQCNRTKTARVVDQGNNVRLFFHPYFDAIPAVRFLDVHITLRPRAITLRWSVFKPTGMPNSLFQQIESHFKLLGLAERYRVMGLDDLRGRRRAIHERFSGTNPGQALGDYLLSEGRSLAAEYGQNHYRAVLLQALGAHAAFCSGGFQVI